ncbi:Hypothetical protein CAP_5492 [Chondromyces apiculatus DSM 436]|uniref:Uncharacterized protein n=1 Tax=Chondromyces apiculatus DSM 436 TaxID=1192034 RepID=A0A017T2Q3_9BACT|nr:Hypothetical protein CAP_5492 [Chondromyces apiculatus DSM 436]
MSWRRPGNLSQEIDPSPAGKPRTSNRRPGSLVPETPE